jgi:uncharacterized paraquat-inducible protein A
VAVRVTRDTLVVPVLRKVILAVLVWAIVAAKVTGDMQDQPALYRVTQVV